MREPSKYQFRLKHILDAIGRLETYASNLSKEELLADVATIERPYQHPTHRKKRECP